MDALFRNPHIVIPFLTYVITQTVKMFLKARKGDFDFKYMFATGDMPSVHTAVAVSLLVSLGFVEGVDSAIFAIGAAWAAFIVYDSFNVRRAVGEQGGVIMKLIELSKAPKDQRDLIKVREVLGHTPLEVLAGAGTGLALGYVLSYKYWPEQLDIWFSVMGGTERLVYYGIFAAVFVSGIVLGRILVRKGQRRLPTARRVLRTISSGLTMPALFGAFFIVMQYEQIRFFRTKGWIYAALIWITISAIIGYIRVFRTAKEQIKDEQSHFKTARRQIRKLVARKKKRK